MLPDVESIAFPLSLWLIESMSPGGICLLSFTFGFAEIKEVARWGGGGVSSSLFSVKHKLLFPELSVSLKATGIILSLGGSLRGGSGGAQLMLE